MTYEDKFGRAFRRSHTKTALVRSYKSTFSKSDTNPRAKQLLRSFPMGNTTPTLFRTQHLIAWEECAEAKTIWPQRLMVALVRGE